MADIFSLPFELMEIVLGHCSFDDVLNFSRTCRAFETLLSSPIWADKMLQKWPELEVYKKCDLDWGKMYYDIMKVRKVWWKKIKEMPAIHHRTGKFLPDECHLEFCDGPELNCFFIKMFLVEICSYTIFYEDFFPVVDKLNMTHQYYAALILDHLNQIDLRKEFSNLFHTENNLPPEEVLQFFNRWIEPKYGHPGQLITCTISKLTKRVHGLIPLDHPFHKIDPVVKLSWSEKSITDSFYPSKASVVIINLVRKVLEHEGFISSIEATFDSLIIQNDIKKIKSNRKYSGIFFESVLRRCGVKCELFSFVVHEFVVWRESWSENSPIHLIDLFTGNVTPLSSNRCPFTGRILSSAHKYNPLRLLDMMATTFKRKVLDTHIRLRRNVLELMVLLNDTINFEFQSSCQQLVGELAKTKLMLNEYADLQKVKEIRPSGMKFAIGMVCYHKLHGYKCIIRGWDISSGEKQPFYQVLTADSTNNYVEEGNLLRLESPHRLGSIEDIIAQEFTHFNGFFYVPNEGKNSQYSEDLLANNLSSVISRWS